MRFIDARIHGVLDLVVILWVLTTYRGKLRVES